MGPGVIYVCGDCTNRACFIVCDYVLVSVCLSCITKHVATTQRHNLLHHHKVSTAQVWWLNLIIELATVSVIHVQKLVKIKLTIQKLWWEIYWPLLWKRCRKSLVNPMENCEEQVLLWSVKSWKGRGQLMKYQKTLMMKLCKVKMRKLVRTTCQLLQPDNCLLVKQLANNTSIMVTDELLYEILKYLPTLLSLSDGWKF